METCVRAGGTITGEHGVGLDKSAYMPLVFSDEDLRAMLQVRAAFDPTGLCNPGKIIPALKGCGEARAVAEGKRAADAGGATMPLAADHKQSAQVTAQSTQAKTHNAQGANARPTANANARHGSEPSNTAHALASIVGAQHVSEMVWRHDAPAAFPAIVAEPGSVEELCEVLRLAASEGWKVVSAGAGTWLEAGNLLRGPRLFVKTTRMARIVEHEPADLVATAEAGLTLAGFNHAAGRAGQWLPLDPPDDGRSTLGGVAATGLGGPQSLGYGTPRSFVLGMRVALHGGRLIRVGSRVVKNVAGYDLCKLFAGSYGTLGVIVELTFKLRPRPAREATLLVRASDLNELLDAARTLAGAQLLPVAVEVLSPRMAQDIELTEKRDGFALLARFAGSEAAVGYQLERAAGLVGGCVKAAAVESVADDDVLWSRLSAAALRERHDLIWRLSVPPSALGAMLTRLDEGSEGACEMSWHAGAGHGRLRVFGATPRRYENAREEVVHSIALLRLMREAARGAGGSLVVERASFGVKRELDAWGLNDSAAFLMRRVKEELDPSDSFSPGRFL
jgi:FAD/FMN-containing dehydrogenase